MTPNYKNVHLKFKLDNLNYKYDDLMEVAYSYVKEGLPYQQELGEFLLDWLDDKDHVIVKTSGSTGKPKKIEIKKQAMVNSAIATGDYFNLKPGDKILHCLPSNFIAGKMTIVRAIVLGLELDMVQPAALPLIDYEKDYTFCAFTPMQLKNFAKYLKNIKTVIVGGGRVSQAVAQLVQDKKPNVYETYGMTETVSHIAVKKLNNFTGAKDEAFFTTLPGIKVSKDKRGCLTINAPKLSDEVIVTNDIVDIISDTSFEWLGRFDNVINSGGIKLYPEQIESKLQDKILGEFFIASREDDTLGDKLILVVEGEKRDIDNAIFNGLDKYEKPKEIHFVSKFKETKSGKINRNKTLESIQLV
ncbi:AMP-binding protein [Algibacter amylolyticus]|uniref:AMP-binding protein n=1 Tax=Algibacter amylolyticus TaxID=1608400 RepID=A0A5M7BDQ0_9FLAO|nr:AMP-binding protein [Algibacter amylolyticus]KAA5825674.1 AMP-binding protein [Algibacter amylolyticus]MBB5268096.1 O-succinylbenzoic acid--CoA ligase [Algibacter amylolyticus]TSJ79972.1 AMP-binding protein [Algibacter amylolyticus]